MKPPVKGLEKLSLIDFPPHASCVIFLGGCNLRCPYCQNPDLIDRAKLPDMDEKEIFSFLDSRKEWLDAVVITGGEPTLYKELPRFIEAIKEKGYEVKLDTNGTDPAMLKDLIERKLVDSVSMDIKAPLEKYESVAKVPVDLEAIEKSVEILNKSDIDYEFRTTIVPDFFSEDTAEELGLWLKGAKRFVLQQFRQDMGTLDESFLTKRRYNKEDLHYFQRILKEHIPLVEIKGI